MSVPLTINGAVFNYPVNFDTGWGIDATGWAQAVTAGMLQKAGGTFALTADVNFGASFGILSKYFTSRTANPSTVGTVRLASADAGIGFRNNANSGNLILTTDASDNLLYNGHIIGGSAAGPVTSITGTANQVIASSPTGAVTLSLPQSIAVASTPTFGGLTLSGSSLIQNASSLGFQDSGSVHTISVQSPSTTATYSLTLPPNAGSSGQVLRTDGAGTTTWVNAAGGGTVNAATAGQLAYYAASSNVVSGNPNLLYTEAAGVTFLNVSDTAAAGLLLTKTGNQMELAVGASGVFILEDVTNSRNLILYTPGANTVATTGAWSFNTNVDMTSHKIVNVTNGSSAQDAVAFDQLTTGAAITTGGVASNTLTGSTANSSGSAGNIAQGTISTPDFRANAVTTSATSVANTVGLTGTSVTTVSITTIGKPVLVSYNFNASGTVAGGAMAIDAWVELDGTEITGSGTIPLSQAASGALRMPIGKTFLHTPSAGAHTYDVRYTVVTGSGVTVSQYSLSAIELRA